MLKGFSVPLTPQGRSALATLPPWHYSSDCIAIEYWTDPEAIAALLPPGLLLDEKSDGRAFFWFLDWQFTGSNDEITDPARYQYREAFALVEAEFEGAPVNYCPLLSLSTTTRRWRAAGPRDFQRSWAASTKRGRFPPPGSGASREGKPFRRKRLGARRTTGDRSYPARGEGPRPLLDIQPSDGDASIFSPTGGQSAGEAAG